MEKSAHSLYCKSVADDLAAIASGERYTCPHCGYAVNKPEPYETSAGFQCYACGEAIQSEDCTAENFAYVATMFEFFADCFDIRYTLDYEKNLCGVRIMIACGGPNVYVDTNNGLVELFWWGETGACGLSREAVDAINAFAKELFFC